MSRGQIDGNQAFPLRCVVRADIRQERDGLYRTLFGASEIEPEEPLFGDGLALDSIDALELALAITQKYSVQLKADDANIREVFGSLRSLSAYIQEHRA